MSAIQRQPSVHRLVVDFDGVTFLESRGIAALMAAYRLAQARLSAAGAAWPRPPCRRASGNSPIRR